MPYLEDPDQPKMINNIDFVPSDESKSDEIKEPPTSLASCVLPMVI